MRIEAEGGNAYMRRSLHFLVAGTLVLAFTSTTLAGGAISIQWGDNSKPQSSTGGVYSQKKGGPPPHAPAHGYRAKHQYRYYPNCNVYHDAGRGVYFYLQGDGWAVGASLPLDLRSDLGVSVNLELDTDKPYEHNAEHLKQYPKEKYKPAKAAKK
jgi:hypothetical protein